MRKVIIKLTIFISILLNLVCITKGGIFDFDFYSENRPSTRANGKGYTGLADTNGIAGVVLNPASLNVDNKFQFHFENIHKNIVPWLVENTYLKEIFPAFLVGGGFRFSNYFQTGIVYYTKNSYQLESIGVEETVFEKYSFYYSEEGKTDSLLVTIMFNYKDKIRFGINLDYSTYNLTRNSVIETETRNS